jgi:hypothetical protein
LCPSATEALAKVALYRCTITPFLLSLHPEKLVFIWQIT